MEKNELEKIKGFTWVFTQNPNLSWGVTFKMRVVCVTP